MQHAITVLPVVPLRSEPSEKAEMTSQLIFGEQLIIHEKHQNWCFVELAHDGYQGWLNNQMIHHIEEDMAMELGNNIPKISAGLFLSVLNNQNKTACYIPAGSSLHNYKPASNAFHISDLHFTCQEEPLFYQHEEARENISQAAIRFLNIPYLWGGKNPFGMDCSGLTQVIMKLFGRSIPRDARQQAEKGKMINFIDEARPGDLAFFDDAEGQIIHTGLIIMNQQIIHASGQVRVDRIDHQGIYSSAIKQYTHKLRLIKNVLD